jgi:hypothetical protein
MGSPPGPSRALVISQRLGQRQMLGGEGRPPSRTGSDQRPPSVGAAGAYLPSAVPLGARRPEHPAGDQRRAARGGRSLPPAPCEYVLHHLRRLDAKIDTLAADVREMKERLSSVERQTAAMRVDFADLRADFVRIEHRLDLHDPAVS